jgi:hypothetical protein
MHKIVVGIDQLPFVGFQDTKASMQMGLVGVELKLWVGVGGTRLTKWEH